VALVHRDSGCAVDMTVAEAQRAPLHLEEASPLVRWGGRDLGVSHWPGPPFNPGRRSASFTTQDACLAHAPEGAGMASHRIVARSSPFAQLTALRSPAPVCPPHTTSRRRVPRNSFAPTRAALHTPSSHHAPTSPLHAALRAHASGSETARSTAQLSASVGGGEEEGGAKCVLLFASE
jgi:hypothetical protein